MTSMYEEILKKVDLTEEQLEKMIRHIEDDETKLRYKLQLLHVLKGRALNRLARYT